MPFYILKNEAITPGLRRIAHEQIGIVLGAVEDDDLPAARKVHSLRARCKKMRSLLRLARPVMGEAYKAEDLKFRAAAKHLAGYRDNEVLAKTIALLGGPAAPGQDPDLPVPREAIESSGRIMRECKAAVDGWPLNIEGFDDIAPGFARTYQRCLDAWHTIRHEPTDEDFHVLRRFAKYHWYQLRILERLNKQAIRMRRMQARDLQKLLGSAHDIVLLEDAFASLDTPDTQLLRRAIARKEALYAQALILGEEVFARTAEDLVADFSRWWAGRRSK